MSSCGELSGLLDWWDVSEVFEKGVLKGVSRSFYLSLRVLPKAMRDGAALGYLLARTSDTLADSGTLPVEVRVKWLEQFGAAVAGECDAPRWPVTLLNAVADSRERRLLEVVPDVLGGLGKLPEAEAALVREVVAVIIGGQRLDVQRFECADQENVVALQSAAELEDYTWRVAGCVGEFWTRLGRAAMGEKFAEATAEKELLERGRRYGMGLQLVNILRDVGADLKVGRCYLPVKDPRDADELLAAHREWSSTAAAWLAEGPAYAIHLRARRLRAASLMPALIGVKTLARMQGADWAQLQQPVKVTRREVYQAALRAFR